MAGWGGGISFDGEGGGRKKSPPMPPHYGNAVMGIYMP